MPVYELSATVELTWSEPDASATVVLHVTAPDGTESSPSTSFSGGAWRASVTGNQYDQWLYTWVSSGTFTGTETDSFLVGGPWYTTLAQLRGELNIRPENTSHDAGLARALTSSARSVEQWCDNRPLGAFLLDGAASAKVFRFNRWTIYDRDWCVYRVPVREFGSLDDLVVETSTDGTTWTATTGYETWPENALDEQKPITHLVFADYGDRLRVTARWGWPVIPSQVAEANLRTAARAYRRKDSPDGVAGSSDWGLIRVPNLDPDVRQMLSFLHTDALVG